MYHINSKYEVYECHAKNQENCPFFGNFDSDNHYDNINDAIAASEQASSSRHGVFSDETPSSMFAKRRDGIANYFNKFGLVGGGNPLPLVSNTREMIDKWFLGDKEVYNSFKVVVSDKTLNHETKKDIVKMLMRGFNVNATNNVRDLKGYSKNDLDNNSEITIIAEQSDKITQDDLKQGKAKPFID